MCLDAFKLVKVHIKYSNTIIKIKTTNNMGKKNFFKKKKFNQNNDSYANRQTHHRLYFKLTCMQLQTSKLKQKHKKERMKCRKTQPLIIMCLCIQTRKAIFTLHSVNMVMVVQCNEK